MSGKNYFANYHQMRDNSGSKGYANHTSYVGLHKLPKYQEQSKENYQLSNFQKFQSRASSSSRMHELKPQISSSTT